MTKHNFYNDHNNDMEDVVLEVIIWSLYQHAHSLGNVLQKKYAQNRSQYSYTVERPSTAVNVYRFSTAFSVSSCVVGNHSLMEEQEILEVPADNLDEQIQNMPEGSSCNQILAHTSALVRGILVGKQICYLLSVSLIAPDFK